MAEWVIAAETQLELHRWLTSELGQRWGRMWVGAVAEDEPRRRDMYEMLFQAEATKLLTADAIWVSPEMCDIVQAARMGFRPEPIEPGDFITHTGFLYFAKPLLMLDRHGKQVNLGAVSWCPFVVEEEPSDAQGMAVTLYTSGKAVGDEFAIRRREYQELYDAPDLTPLHITVTQFGEPLDQGDLEDERGEYTAADEWWKTLQTALRMMQQRISSRYSTRLPRPTRRRFQRQGNTLSEVLVIRLRRPAPKHHTDEETSPREWTHQWLVDGHWRNQWYPSLNSHRQIWISPYVKGPEGTELVIKRRFYKWDR